VTPDGRHVVSGERYATVKLWDLETGALIHTFKGHANTITDVAVTPDGRHAVSGSYDRTVRLWDIETPAR
jgi:WD40 repeat protein